MKVLFTTPLPVPYQVELFDALASSNLGHVRVLYDFLTHASRSWQPSTLRHDHHTLSDLSSAQAEELIQSSDLVVFSGYQRAESRRLIASRAESRRPWCFWGERPGFLVPQWLGRHYRSIALASLGRSNAPIWGIGSWAVEGYQREYGSDRSMFNVPYFSNLTPFLKIDRSSAQGRPKRILFSGSLIKRKGVDLLLEAFLAVATEYPELELHLIGDGPLRQSLQRQSQPFADRIYFHGFKQWADLPGAYSNADILCAPSRHDGWGLIIPEGLAAGLLVVSTDRTGAARDLIDSSNGWVVEAGALEPLVWALRAAAETEGAERLERIERGRARAEGQHVTAGVERIMSAIEQTVACPVAEWRC